MNDILKMMVRMCKLGILGAGLISAQANAFQLIQISPGQTIPWAGNTASILTAWNPTYDAAYQDALGDWNNKADFEFKISSGSFVDPCLNDGVSTYKFSASNCALSWNSSTLAITYSKFSLSPAHTYEVDTIYNSAHISWGIHNQSQAERSDIDFRRVVVHESGHAVGLAHSSVNPAIMQPVYSSTVLSVKADDINGLIALYGNLPPKPVPPGLASTLFLLLN